MRQFLSFVRKEFIHILRDPRSLLILLAMPLVMVILLGYVVKNETKDIRLHVIDLSHDVVTQKITERLSANKYFIYKGEVNNEEEAGELFRKGDTDIVVIYGSEFGSRLMHSRDASIQILSDGSEPNQASVRVTYASQVISAVQRDLQASLGGGTSFNIRIGSRLLYNPQQRSEINFVPGIIGIIMLLICCMMTSIAIVRERETGTMEILLASPLPTIDIVLAKLVPYMAIGIFDLATILCLTNFVMDIPMAGSFWVYALVALIYIFTALMLGLLISTLVNTQLAAMLISLLLIIPGLYLSGMIFPLENLPAPAQVISNAVPAKWFISASRKIMIEGVPAQYVIKEIVALLVEGFALLLLSWKFFKTRLE